ncbi:MAG: hypothetical protein JWM77_188 [Rhodospirillales bacterium]|nr:hypothetical protein [Rhodospirillales bacterium]
MIRFREGESGSDERPIFETALRARCPRCGRGRLYDGALALRPACEVCGLDLAGQDPGDGPAVLGIFVLGFLLVPLSILFDWMFSPPLWLTTIIFAILLVGCAIFGLRVAKAAFIALNFRHRKDLS